mmetsp:Transcript_20804/g.35733  ORF Transcript_20804/g.35733 Transcript_20804/m.35733 type:complete len:212 (-) Transcript_20804:765-1400(-)
MRVVRSCISPRRCTRTSCITLPSPCSSSSTRVTWCRGACCATGSATLLATTRACSAPSSRLIPPPSPPPAPSCLKRALRTIWSTSAQSPPKPGSTLLPLPTSSAPALPLPPTGRMSRCAPPQITCWVRTMKGAATRGMATDWTRRMLATRVRNRRKKAQTTTTTSTPLMLAMPAATKTIMTALALRHGPQRVTAARSRGVTRVAQPNRKAS